MKKTFFYYLFAVLCTVTFMTSCSDDDDPSYPIDEEIAGTYKGALDITLEGTPIASGLPKNITITKASNSTVNMELKDFAFMGMNLGTITLKDCAVSQEGTSYSFTSEQTLTLSSEIGSCLIKVNGTITGTKATINLDIEVTKLDQKVKVVYTGTRLSGSESAEAKITSFIFDRKVAAVDSLVVSAPVIDEAKKTITFMVADTITIEQLKQLVPTVVISDKATVIPGSNVAQNFNSPVVYTVIAENGIENQYTVSVSHTVTAYDFEDWSNKGNMYPDILNPIGWATCNDAVGLIKNMGSFAGIEYKGEYPVRATDDCVTGKKAVLMESVDTKGGNLFGQNVPKVTSGTAFLGIFDAIAALQDPMATTSFGVIYKNKPIEVTGSFKYTAGKEYYDGNNLQADKKDECALSAVLYEVTKEDDTLNGSTIYTSDKIIASAMMTNGGTAEYTPFSLKLQYIKPYDANKMYKLAVIFASSKEGAAYKGAIGSKLFVDNVIIVNE